MQEIIIVDTTLRDGEQAAGVAFSAAEKLTIAKMLDQAGVTQMEAGIPAMGREEQQTISNLVSLGLKARLLTWNRLKLADIRASIECGVKLVHISAPVSDILINYKLRKTRGWVLDSLKRAIYFARASGCAVSVGAEDASRADFGFLLKLAEIARQEGAERLRYADTLGILDPFTACERIRKLVDAVGLDLEIHAHNDFGMATANTLGAVRGGARFISTTVNGIGERAGNAPMEEVANAIQKLYHRNLGLNTEALPELAKYVAGAANRRVPAPLPYRNLVC